MTRTLGHMRKGETTSAVASAARAWPRFVAGATQPIAASGAVVRAPAKSALAIAPMFYLAVAPGSVAGGEPAPGRMLACDRHQ